MGKRSSRQQTRHGVSGWNHVSRRVPEPREARKGREDIRIFLGNLVHVVVVNRVENENDHVLLRRHLHEPISCDEGFSRDHIVAICRTLGIGKQGEKTYGLHHDQHHADNGRAALEKRSSPPREEDGRDKDQEPDEAREKHHGCKFSPVDRRAISNRESRVHERPLDVHAQPERHDHGKEHVEGAAPHQGNAHSENESGYEGKDGKRHPHVAHAEDEAFVTARDHLERSDDAYRVDKEYARQQREHEAEGPALILGTFATNQRHLRCGKFICLSARMLALHAVRIDTMNRPLLYLAGILIDIEAPIYGLAHASPCHAQNSRQRNGDTRERLNRVRHDGRVDVSQREARACHDDDKSECAGKCKVERG